MEDRTLENFVNDDKNMDLKVEIVDKRKYKQAFCECKKLCTFIKTVVGRNITVL